MNKDVILDSMSEKLVDMAIMTCAKMEVPVTEDIVKGFALGFITMVDVVSAMADDGIDITEALKNING